jgi:methylmalonyl-CoA/ethylmalonyl-CoA epimerase
MLTQIDHLGIAVDNLAESVAAWEAIGLRPAGTEEVAEQKVRVAMFPCGESRVELLESTDPEGPIGRFIAKRGPGIHHVAFRVDDIRETLAGLKARGVRLIDEEPREGADGMLIAFVHPSATGVLVEVCQPAVRDAGPTGTSPGPAGAEEGA